MMAIKKDGHSYTVRSELEFTAAFAHDVVILDASPHAEDVYAELKAHYQLCGNLDGLYVEVTTYPVARYREIDTERYEASDWLYQVYRMLVCELGEASEGLERERMEHEYDRQVYYGCRYD